MEDAVPRDPGRLFWSTLSPNLVAASIGSLPAVHGKVLRHAAVNGPTRKRPNTLSCCTSQRLNRPDCFGCFQKEQRLARITCLLFYFNEWTAGYVTCEQSGRFLPVRVVQRPRALPEMQGRNRRMTADTFTLIWMSHFCGNITRVLGNGKFLPVRAAI